MNRTDATTDIAVMADKHALRDWPVCHFPRDAMRQPRFATDTHVAVSLNVARAFPEPARFRLADLRPENLVKRQRSGGVFAVLGPKAHGACHGTRLLDPAFRNERCSAKSTATRRYRRRVAVAFDVAQGLILEDPALRKRPLCKVRCPTAPAKTQSGRIHQRVPQWSLYHMDTPRTTSITRKQEGG